MDWSEPFEGGEYASFFWERGYAVAGEVFGEERVGVLRRGSESIPDGEAVAGHRGFWHRNPETYSDFCWAYSCANFRTSS